MKERQLFKNISRAQIYFDYLNDKTAPLLENFIRIRT